MTHREFASKGGRARAKALSKERRLEIAKLAGQASALARQLASKREACQSDKNGETK